MFASKLERHYLASWGQCNDTQRMGKQTGDILLLHDAVQSCELQQCAGHKLDKHKIEKTNKYSCAIMLWNKSEMWSDWEKTWEDKVRKGEAALNLYRILFFRFSFKASSASKNVNSHTNNCPNRSPLGHPQCVEQLNLPDILQPFSYIPIIRV